MYQTWPSSCVCIAIDGGGGREGEPPSQLTPLVGYVFGEGGEDAQGGEVLSGRK